MRGEEGRISRELLILLNTDSALDLHDADAAVEVANDPLHDGDHRALR